MSGPEVALRGGTANRGLVVRVGDTVRRPPAPAGEGIRALLAHVRGAGFDGAPAHLGIDEKGREVFTFVTGDVPVPPYPGWALTDDALVSVAGLLRRYHDAAAGFDPTPYAWPVRVPEPFRGSLVTHNDPNLDNIVFRDGEAVAIIDFDLASPATPLWDVALAARLWVPLRDPADVGGERAERTAERLRSFVDAYGVSGAERRLLPAAALATHEWCYDIIREGARAGQPGYAAYWTPGAQAHDERGRAWLARNQRWLASVL